MHKEDLELSSAVAHIDLTVEQAKKQRKILLIQVEKGMEYITFVWHAFQECSQ